MFWNGITASDGYPASAARRSPRHDAGASLYVGHGAPRLHGVELYCGRAARLGRSGETRMIGAA